MSPPLIDRDSMTPERDSIQNHTKWRQGGGSAVVINEGGGYYTNVINSPINVHVCLSIPIRLESSPAGHPALADSPPDRHTRLTLFHYCNYLLQIFIVTYQGGGSFLYAHGCGS